MDGIIANLQGICDLAETYDALVMVDDSHAVGFVGAHGKGTPEYCAVMGRVHLLTGTLGKALGGASGGYTSGKQAIIDVLRQRSRPYLFSNALCPMIVGASLEVLDMLWKKARRSGAPSTPIVRSFAPRWWLLVSHYGGLITRSFPS